jgi:hypothetical protein
MTSSTLPAMIAMLENLNDSGFFTNKMNQGLSIQSLLLTTTLMPCFEKVTAHPIGNIFTDHLLFAGKGFSKENLKKYRVMNRLMGCMDLSRESVPREYEKRRDYFEERRKWGEFERRVASRSEKLDYDDGVDIFKMAQVILEGALSRRVIPGSGAQGWLAPQLRAALNQEAFRHIKEGDQERSRRLMLEILESPPGTQLPPAFDPVILKLHRVPRPLREQDLLDCHDGDIYSPVKSITKRPL